MAEKDLSHVAMPTGMQNATRYCLQKFEYNPFCNYSLTFAFIATVNGPSGSIARSIVSFQLSLNLSRVTVTISLTLYVCRSYAAYACKTFFLNFHTVNCDSLVG